MEILKEVCWMCNGSGDSPWNPNLHCPECGGEGELTKQEEEQP